VIVYVESNFVLEIALLQEQHSACEALLDLCANGRIQILLPTYAMIEPFSTLFRRRAERNVLKGRLGPILRELGRTAPLSRSVEEAQASLDHLLGASSNDELKRWKTTRSRIASVAELIPFEERVLQAAAASEVPLNLSPPDAVMYASIRSHLSQTRPARSCFLNRNYLDFQNPALVTELNALGCKVLPAFDQGLGYVRGMLARSG
jgi:predicted nucleic acid-binding protein